MDTVLLQDDIRREAQTMSLIDHPNVIRAHCSFVVDSNLWVVMPFMAEGSCLHLMKIAYQDGFEEAAIGSILKETLKALDYLHHQGHIHRDVKVLLAWKFCIISIYGFIVRVYVELCIQKFTCLICCYLFHRLETFFLILTEKLSLAILESQLACLMQVIDNVQEILL